MNTFCGTYQIKIFLIQFFKAIIMCINFIVSQKHIMLSSFQLPFSVSYLACVLILTFSSNTIGTNRQYVNRNWILSSATRCIIHLLLFLGAQKLKTKLSDLFHFGLGLYFHRSTCSSCLLSSSSLSPPFLIHASMPPSSQHLPPQPWVLLVAVRHKQGLH